MTDIDCARPFIKWVGGKRRLTHEILKHLPRGTRYFEPFLGGGAVFYALQPPWASLSDTNSKLVNAYLALQQNAHDVIEHLQNFRNSRDEFDRVKRNNFQVGTTAQRAADFIFCNRVGFNGLYRVNASGQFNVPFGDNPKATICDAANLLAVSSALRNIEIGVSDFEAVVQDALPGDAVYFDPPYVPLSKTSSFTGYTALGFGPADQRRLRDVATGLRARGVHVVISNSYTPLVEELYADWTIEAVNAGRSINSKADRRGPVAEALIY